MQQYYITAHEQIKVNSVCFLLLFTTIFLFSFYSDAAALPEGLPIEPAIASYCSYAQPGPIRWLDPFQSDWVIMLVSVLFGKCITLVSLPCGDQHRLSFKAKRRLNVTAKS